LLLKFFRPGSIDCSDSFLFLFPSPSPSPVTVISSLVAAWLLTHEIKGFMLPELQQVVRERERKRERKRERERKRILAFLFQTKPLFDDPPFLSSDP
jgi:hypothetical protein